MGDTAPPASAPMQPRDGHNFHRGRRRGGASGDMYGLQDGNTRGSGFRGGRNERGGRGRGRGRVQSNHERIPSLNGASQPNSAVPPRQPPQGPDGAVLPTDAVRDHGETQGKATTTESAVDDSIESDVCFICASPIEHTSIAPCNHQTCHICSLRLRALYKTRACAHCRVSLVSHRFLIYLLTFFSDRGSICNFH